MYIKLNNNYNNNQLITYTVTIALPEHSLAVKFIYMYRENRVGIKKTYVQALCSTYDSVS